MQQPASSAGAPASSPSKQPAVDLMTRCKAAEPVPAAASAAALSPGQQAEPQHEAARASLTWSRVVGKSEPAQPGSASPRLPSRSQEAEASPAQPSVKPGRDQPAAQSQQQAGKGASGGDPAASGSHAADGSHRRRTQPKKSPLKPAEAGQQDGHRVEPPGKVSPAPGSMHSSPGSWPPLSKPQVQVPGQPAAATAAQPGHPRASAFCAFTLAQPA